MAKNYEKTGVATPEDLAEVMPTKERLKKGPAAIIECPQEIPCNACVVACPRKLITKEKIVSMPKLEGDKCTGCAMCIRKCPGLAIYVIDMCNSPEGKAWITIPYEFLPIPKVGDMVRALNREGKDLGAAKVVKVVPSKEERTALVTFEVDEGIATEARFLRC